VANILNLTKPWYSTEHARTVDQLFDPNVERVHGDIPFHVAQYQNLEVVILDEQGRIRKQLIKSVRYGPGNYTMPIDLWVKHWEKGEYTIELRSDDHMLKRETFEI